MASAAPLQCPTRQTRIYIVCDVAIDLILELIGCACDGAPLNFEEPAATASVQLDNLLVRGIYYQFFFVRLLLLNFFT
jgi:hypothetical protein